MTVRGAIDRVFQQEDINFLLTNRIPRRLLTRFVGWFSAIEQPLIRDLSLTVWRLFAGDLHLEDAKKTSFTSLHDCFIRELKDGARPIDSAPETVVSPCDAIVGAFGRVRDTELIQAKRSTYTLDDLVIDQRLVERYRNGVYVTLRLTSTMYHRFHAPHDCVVESVSYVSGDLWNVNPIALKRVPRLFCQNERAILDTRLRRSAESLMMVPVGAILVGSICLTFLESPFNLRERGPHRIGCQTSIRKGDEMGYFQHGSTIIVFGTAGLVPTPNVVEGRTIRMGEPLFSHSASGSARPA